MATKKAGGRAAAIVKTILLILAVIVIIAAVVVAVYFGTNGFGGSYPTFVLRVNGETVTQSGALELPSGSELNISGFEDYSLKAEVAEPEEDFKIKVGDAGMRYSELVGEDITAGFTFTKAEDGADIMVYHARTEKEITGNPLYNPNRHAMLMRVKWNRGEDGVKRPVFNYD